MVPENVRYRCVLYRLPGHRAAILVDQTKCQNSRNRHDFVYKYRMGDL